MKYKLRTSLLVALAFLTSTAAHASLLNYIDHGSYFTSTAQRLDWLKLTSATTLDSSYDHVTSELTPSGPLAGWSYATEAQFIGMFQSMTGIVVCSPLDPAFPCPTGSQELTFSSGVQSSVAGGASNVPATWYEFVNYLEGGQPVASPIPHSVAGLLTNQTTTGYHGYALFTIDSLGLTPPSLAILYPGQGDSAASLETGTYLIRQATNADLPTPPTDALFGIGLLGLGLARRKHNARNG